MFAVSKNNANIIQKRYDRNVEILHNGVDINIFKRDEKARFELRKKYNLENKKVLISVGRVVALKGYQLVIKALKDFDDVCYVLIGKGEYLDSLKKLATELKVEDKVLFLGEIKNNKLNKYLSMADVFVQPTIGNEAFGITIIEAMACENAIVTTNYKYLSDVVNEKNGVLVKPKSVENLKSGIESLLNNMERLREIQKYNKHCLHYPMQYL
jgi:glycosyltransferase involved in cell wall biosynthesis